MLTRIRRSLSALAQRTRFERDMRDELETHIALRADELAASGIARDEARRRARVEFGAVEAYKERCRDVRGFAAFRPLHGLWGDVRLGARRLAGAPLFLIFAVVSLAIGIAVTTAVYSILYAMFWKPLGVRDVGEVAVVTTVGSGAPRWRNVISRPDFEDLRASQTAFFTLVASTHGAESLVSLAASEIVPYEAVTGDYFEMLGVRAAVGRLIQPGDGDRAVLVLGNRHWRTQFNADPQVIGRLVRLGGHPFEVIGVAPRSFEGLGRLPPSTVVWIPLDAAGTFSPGPVRRSDRERRHLTVVGRLARGQRTEHAAVEAATVSDRLDAVYPIGTEHHPGREPQGGGTRQWSAVPVEEALDAGETRIGILVIGLVGLVLVVACTNLANLMLARGTMRQHEIAIRRALGGSRWRLVRELCVESALVGALGGVLALALTRALLVAGTFEIRIPRGALSVEPTLNWSALLVASAGVLLSIAVFGLEPALQLTRESVNRDLAAQSGGIEPPRSRRQRALIRWQVAISTCFFLITAVLVKVIAAGAVHDSGILLDRLALASVHFSMLRWDEARSRRTLEAAMEIARREPAIESIAVSSGMPFGSTLTTFATMTTPDRPFVENGRFEGTYFLSSTPDIFRTLGVPIVRGRAFDAHDDAASVPVAIISERTARAMFGTTDPIGRQLMFRVWDRPPQRTFTIVGIARDTDAGRLMWRDGEVTYVPFAQHYEPNVFVVARTSGKPAVAVRVLQAALRRSDPDLGTGTAGPASTLLAGHMVAARVAGMLAGGLGLLALILAMIGLYGIQIHVVASRIREVGLRLALGASGRQIRLMILREGYRPVIEGVVLGIVFGVIVRLGLRALMRQRIHIFDPLAFALVAIGLLAAAFLACYLPARRASRVDPNVALRHL